MVVLIDFVYEQEATWKGIVLEIWRLVHLLLRGPCSWYCCDYLSALGMENIHAYLQELVDYVGSLQAINDLIVYGPEDPSQHAGVIA